jgi:hypothetical protein
MTATPIEAPNAICVKESIGSFLPKNQSEVAAQTHDPVQL